MTRTSQIEAILIVVCACAQPLPPAPPPTVVLAPPTRGVSPFEDDDYAMSFAGCRAAVALLESLDAAVPEGGCGQ